MQTLKNRLKAFAADFRTPDALYEKLVVSQSLLHARVNRQKSEINSLADIEFRGFSQWGEDGIIDWLIEKLPGIPERFVEFGVEDYRESNTRLLLWLRNWRGTVIDGSARHIENIRQQEVAWRFDLQPIAAFIDRENINQLIAGSGLKGEIGILSIDIDGNDYWVWNAIDVVNPVLIVCEYNSLFGDLRRLCVPYQADFQRTRAHYSNLYYGASLQALIALGIEKGYTCVGSNSTGSNLFFIRNDRASEVVSRIRNIALHRSKVRESRNEEGGLTFSRGHERLKIINHLPVYDFDARKECTLGDLGDICSPNWRDN